MISLTLLAFLPFWALLLFGFGAPVCATLDFTIHDGVEWALMCMVIGLGTLGLVASIIGLAGWLYSSVVWLIVVVGLLGVGWYLRVWWLSLGGWQDTLPKLPRVTSHLRSLSRWQQLTLLILCLHVGLNLGVALGPPVEGDTTHTYLALPKLFLRHSGIFFAYPAVEPVSLYHAFVPFTPLSMQMVYAVGLIVGGETAAQLVSQLAGILLALMIFQLARKLVDSSRGSNAGLLAAALFYMTPLANYHGHAAKIDFAAALMEFSGIYAFVVWYAGRSDLHNRKRRRWFWLSALFLGYAISMRPSGLYSVALLGAFLAILWILRRPERAGFKELLVWGTILLFAGGLWYLVTYLIMGNPFYPTHLGEGPILPEGIPTGLTGMILLFTKMSLGPVSGGWGLVESIGPLFIAALPLIPVTMWRRRRGKGIYLLLGLFCLAYYVLWFQLYPITRLLMAAVGVAGVLVAISLTDLVTSQSWKILKYTFVAILPFVFTLNLGLNFIVARHFLPMALGLETRQTVLAQMLSGPLAKPSWSTLSYINSNLSARSRILGIPWGHSYYLDHAELVSAQGVDLSGDTSEVLRTLEKSGFTHVFWNEWLLEDIERRGDDVSPHALDSLRKSQHLEIEYADEEALQYVYRIVY